MLAVAEMFPDLDSRAIQFVCRSPYSHIAVLVVFPDGSTEMIYEATTPKSRKIDAGKILVNHKFVHKIEVTHLLKKTPEQALKWLEDRMDIDYGMVQWPGFVFGFLRFLGRNGMRKLVCSEFGAAFIEDNCEIDLWDDLDFVNPKQLIDTLIDHTQGGANGIKS